jgi:cytochrome c-type biogenesis protein CcmH
MIRRLVIAMATVLTLAAVAPTAAYAQEPRASLPDIEDEVMCPICGTLLELSDAPQAERERAFIRDRIEQGQTKDQIKDALVAEYGPEVLAEPGGSGFDLAAWLIPGLGIALAALLVGRFALSRRHADEPEVEEELEPADRERLDEDLSRYEL